MSKNLIFLVVASVVVSTVSLIILEEDISGAGGIGYVIGLAAGTLGMAVLLAFIPAGIYWLFKRKRMPGLNITVWVLWGLFAALVLVGNLDNDFEVAQREIGKSVIALHDQRLESSATGAELHYDPGPIRAKGELGEAERFAKEFLADLAAIENRYMSKLDAIGFDTLLDGQRLHSDLGLQESSYILARAREAVNENINEYYSLIEDVPNRINDLGASQHFKSDMRRGFSNGYQSNQPDTVRLLELEVAAMDIFDEMTGYLRKNRDQWDFENEQIVFTTQDLADSYNAFFVRLDNVILEQDEIQQAFFDQTRSLFQ